MERSTKNETLLSIGELNIVSWLSHHNASRVLSKRGGAEQLWSESQGTQPMTSGWLLIFRCRNEGKHGWHENQLRRELRSQHPLSIRTATRGKS